MRSDLREIVLPLSLSLPPDVFFAGMSARSDSTDGGEPARTAAPGQRRLVARTTRNWPPPASTPAVTGSPGTSRENRSTSQSAAS